MSSLATDLREWVEYMRSQGVSREDFEKAGNYTMETAWYSRDVIENSLEGIATDHFGALSVRRSWVICTVACRADSCAVLDVDTAVAPDVRVI